MIILDSTLLRVHTISGQRKLYQKYDEMNEQKETCRVYMFELLV